MNIAFYAPMKSPTHSTPSGDRRMANLLMEAWQKSGNYLELASEFRSYDKGDTTRQKRLKSIGEKLAIRLIRRYRSRPMDQRPDIWFTYHLYHKAPDWLGAVVSSALDIPYVIAEASYAPKQAGGPWDLGHHATAHSLSKASVIIGFNKLDGRCISPLLEGPDKQILFPPFIDTTPYHQAMQERHKHQRALTDQLNLPAGTPILLCVAMMRYDQKLQSYQVLGKSLSKLLNRPWQLVVIGSGPASEAVEEALAPLSDRVTWLGNQQEDDLPSFYAGSDLFVWPAIKESYGMVFLEALSTGLPVVAGRTPGVEGIVSNEQNGLLVTTGDADAFSNAVTRMLDDPHLRKTMSRTAHEDMMENHDLKQMSSRLGDLATSITSRPTL